MTLLTTKLIISDAHTPVLLPETLEFLNLQKGKWYLDGTFGAGGHTKALLNEGMNVLAIDQDPNVQSYVKDIESHLAGQSHERFKFAQGNFEAMQDLAASQGLAEVSGILLDLGVSSMQLDEAERGFAFRKEGPLDMRMSASGESAADIINEFEAEDIAAILFKYGEERYSRRIARVIVEERSKKPIQTTEELVEIIRRAYPKGRRQDHPARRSFQALRIYVNDELGVLERSLKAAETLLGISGRLVVMSYHSLEDRIVKHFIRNSEHLKALTKKPVIATDEECERNPRARSAKLRVAERVAL